MVAILSRDDIHSGNGDRVGRESLGLWEKAGKEGCGLQATLQPAHCVLFNCSHYGSVSQTEDIAQRTWHLKSESARHEETALSLLPLILTKVQQCNVKKGT